MPRISRTELFAGILELVAERSTCDRKHVGAILVREGRILAIGYNGSPPGLPHCQDYGCIPGPDGGCLRTQHAEANLIAFSAKEGIITKGADIWSTLSPCLPCAKLIASAGIKTLYFKEKYRDQEGLDFLIRCNVSFSLYGPA